MALNLTNEGKTMFLQWLTGRKLLLHLYKNEVDSRDGTLTLKNMEENDEEGYAPLELKPEAWRICTNLQGITMAVHDPVAFSFVSPVEKSYGYYVTDESNERLMWAEPFEDKGFFWLPLNGGQIVVNTRLLIA